MSFVNCLDSNPNKVLYKVDFKNVVTNTATITGDLQVNTIDGLPYPPAGIPITIPLDHIITGNGGLPPYANDSGIIAGSIPAIYLPTTGTVIDLDPANSFGNLIAYDDFSKAIVIFSNGNGQDSDIVIGNNSTVAKGVQIFNSSGGDIDIFSNSGNINMGGDQVYLADTLNNNTIFLNNNQINLTNNTNNNFINIDGFGINIQTLGIGQTSTLSADGNVSVQSASNTVRVQEFVGNNLLECNANSLSMNTGGGNNLIEVSLLNNNCLIKNNTNNNYIQVDTNGCLIQAGGTNGILVQTGGSNIINSSYRLPISGNGIADQICVIDALNQMSFVNKSFIDKSLYMASINAVPAGALWTRTIGTIPYNSVSYSGFEVSQGTDITYNNLTGVWSLKAGKYKCLVVQSVNVSSNVVNPELSNFRIKLLDSTPTQIKQDSGRYETFLGSVGALLAYDVSLNIVFETLIDDTFTINVTDETGGGLGGALLGKGSCIFERIG